MHRKSATTPCYSEGPIVHVASQQLDRREQPMWRGYSPVGVRLSEGAPPPVVDQRRLWGRTRTTNGQRTALGVSAGLRYTQSPGSARSRIGKRYRLAEEARDAPLASVLLLQVRCWSLVPLGQNVR